MPSGYPAIVNFFCLTTNNYQCANSHARTPFSTMVDLPFPDVLSASPVGAAGLAIGVGSSLSTTVVAVSMASPSSASVAVGDLGGRCKGLLVDGGGSATALVANPVPTIARMSPSSEYTYAKLARWGQKGGEGREGRFRMTCLHAV